MQLRKILFQILNYTDIVKEKISIYSFISGRQLCGIKRASLKLERRFKRR